MLKRSVLLCLLFASLSPKMAQASVASVKLPNDENVKIMLDQIALLVREVVEVQDSLVVL